MLQISHGHTASGDARHSRTLRILHVVPTYFPAVRYGGPIRSVHALAKASVARGHEVHVFTSSMDGPKNLDVPLAQPVDLDGVLVHYFSVPGVRRLCWCPAMQTALKRDIGSFDVVHLHSVFLWPTWAAARAARAAGIPYLVSPRGMLSAAVISRKSQWVKGAWIRFIEQRTLRDAAGVHVTADLEREELEALGLKLPRIFCVHNGVSWPDRHTVLAEGPFADVGARPYALFLGRIDPKKGLDRLLAAWHLVPGLTLVIAGNDEAGYRAELDQIAAENAIGSRVRFIGPVSDEHKWALYEHAVMFVLPSYFENFGNTVAEAMAMGCPVVVTPEVGLARLVQESGAGVVVEGAPRALAEAVRGLLQDSTKRRTMGEQGRLAARQHLSWESAAIRTESIYEEIRPKGGADRSAGRSPVANGVQL